MKVYSANKYDCVGFVLEKLGLDVSQRKILPQGWWYSENCLIKNISELLNDGKLRNIRIKSFILKQELLVPGDIVFLRLRGKFTHHIGIMIENGHIEHNLPGRGVTKDFLRPNSNFFRFGVRLWV